MHHNATQPLAPTASTTKHQTDAHSAVLSGNTDFARAFRLP